MIALDQNTCRNLDAATRREWLETNGIGGFACGTVAGLHTRRYHGLLTAALKPPVGRTVLVSKLEETLVLNGRSYELSANRYQPGIVHPHGFRHLAGFRLDPFPVFVYRVEDVEIEKSIFMVQGENTTVVEYLVRASLADHAKLILRPLIAFRDYHSTTHQNPSLNGTVYADEGCVRIRPYEGQPDLFIAHDGAGVDAQGFWYRNFEYSVERERGLDFTEDLYSPCALVFDLANRSRVSLVASTEKRDAMCAAKYHAAEVARRAEIARKSPSDHPLVRSLTVAADQFVARRQNGHTLIAGYPWFSDWGRDTMIALPGIAMTTGRTDLARSIMAEFSRHVSMGMLPNRFPDAGAEPEYNTVDASLWYIEAARALQCPEFIRKQLWPSMREIIDWHQRGTRYGIHVDTDGLLSAGEPGVQLTWMDAKVGDWVVTPRHGKPVEIQALWYNALRIMEQFAREFGDADAGRYGEMAEAAKQSFQQQFWNEDASCLYDVIDDDLRDASIRPNQVFAVSLPYTMMEPNKSRRLLEVVEHHLLTPFGLRSLSPEDPAYRGRYEGGPLERDGAYHQGTVWAFLMGPFLTAYIRVHGDAGRAQAREWLAAFESHLTDAGLGQISEIFDGDAPHQPRGCFAQAWSVSELLRAAAT